MSDNIKNLLNGEPGIFLFHDPRPSRLVLGNGENDQAIIPNDLLPESQRNGTPMVDAVACVRHLVKTIRELEDENADLRGELKAALERC